MPPLPRPRDLPSRRACFLNVPVPDWPTNAAFGDADGRTLYITGQGMVYWVRLADRGLY